LFTQPCWFAQALRNYRAGSPIADNVIVLTPFDATGMRIPQPDATDADQIRIAFSGLANFIRGADYTVALDAATQTFRINFIAPVQARIYQLFITIFNQDVRNALQASPFTVTINAGKISECMWELSESFPRKCKEVFVLRLFASFSLFLLSSAFVRSVCVSSLFLYLPLPFFRFHLTWFAFASLFTL
jgi:hypothetical protein